MAHIYTGLDIGNGYIKIVVVNANLDKYYVLATTSVKTNGLKKNVIYDEKKLKNSLTTAIKNIEDKIGMKIREVILCLPARTEQTGILQMHPLWLIFVVCLLE